MSKYRTWTEEEMDILTSFSNDPEGDTIDSIAEYLGRSKDSVNGKLYHMRRQNKYVARIEKRWSKQEDEMLINTKGKLKYEELGKVLNRSKSAVTHRAINLGISKNKICFSEIGKSIKKMAAGGYTRKEIAEELSLEYAQVRGYIYRNKIECKTEVLKNTKTRRFWS